MQVPYDNPKSGLLNVIAAQRCYPTQQAQNNVAAMESPLPIR